MMERPRFGFPTLLGLVLVLGVAGAARGWYLCACVENALGPTPLAVQDAPRPVPQSTSVDHPFHKQPNELDTLVHHLHEEQWFATVAPLAERDELSAHTAPGYAWLLAQVVRVTADADAALQMVRWTQAGLGALTAGLYFLFAWRAFRSNTVALLTGLSCAVYPFWVVNVAEIADGTVTTFLLALTLFLGSLAARPGAAFSSLLFGLSLAGLPMMRATLLPFALVACLWFLLRCRTVQRGWLCGLVAVLGLVNGLAPWALRNYQAFHDAIPVSNATYLHLWVGNNATATGGPQDEEALRWTLAYLPNEKRILAEKDQTKRYRLLSEDVLEKVREQPNRAVRLRIMAALYFVFGQEWFANDSGNLCHVESGDSLPGELQKYHPVILQGTLLAMLLLGFVGWRWTYGWRRETRLATLALLWVPLPYVLGHAEALSGPRLPLDGVLLCHAAFAVSCLVPGVGRWLFRGVPR